MKIYITMEEAGKIIDVFHGDYLRNMLSEVSHLHIEKFDSIWRIHQYPYLIMAKTYDCEGFVIAVNIHGIGSKEKEIEDLRKWCIENYIIKVSPSSIDFRYNTDYFTSFSLDEEWVNVLFKIYARIVQANTEMWKDDLLKISQEMNE